MFQMQLGFFDVKPWLKAACLACLGVGLWAAPVRAQLPASVSPLEEGCWKARAELVNSPEAARPLLFNLAGRSGEARTAYAHAFLAWTLALGAERLRATDPAGSQRLETAAESSLGSIAAWAGDYGQMLDIHGDREPAWVHSQPEAVAQAVLAWTTLEKCHPNPSRHALIQKFAEGLVLLHHEDPHIYPFMAHTSFAPGRPEIPAYAPLLERAPGGESGESGLREVGKAPGAMWIPERSRQVEALVAAYQLLGDKTFLDEAQQEGLGIWAHLVVSDKLPFCFAPTPLGKPNLRAASVVVDQFSALCRVNSSPVYATLLGLAGTWERSLTPQSESEKDAQRCIHAALSSSLARFRSASDLYPPVSYQIMQAEAGKAVQKAFDLVNVVYPDGSSGKMTRVGRENMFWIRFDVDREQDYHFYVVFLKSKLEGGLISVLMRIDGDKIIKVPLGGATDPYVDMDFVDGPRPLRQGPHSFGIRFSGLLMTQPALLDCILAWPVVERRYLKLDGGRRLLVLHNRSPREARAFFKEIGTASPQITAIDGHGVPATVGRQIDKRRHREFLLMPAGGTAVLEWNEGNSSSVP